MLSIKTRFAIIILTLMIMADLLIYLLYTYNYKFSMFLTTGVTYPLLINLAVMLIFIFLLPRLRWLTILTAFLLLVLFLGYLFFHKLWSYEYYSLTSPQGTNKIYIEQRTATLGETNYFYNFYESEPYLNGLIIKRLNAEELHLISSSPSIDNALQLTAPTWISENTILFHTIDGDHPVSLHSH